MRTRERVHALVKLRHVSKVILMNGSTRPAETAWDTRPSSENPTRYHCACICGLSSAIPSIPGHFDRNKPLRSSRALSIDRVDTRPARRRRHLRKYSTSKHLVTRWRLVILKSGRRDVKTHSAPHYRPVGLISSVTMKTRKNEESAQ